MIAVTGLSKPLQGSELIYKSVSAIMSAETRGSRRESSEQFSEVVEENLAVEYFSPYVLAKLELEKSRADISYGDREMAL